jgi:MoaA/NifB/PqqE/SkfB family radical SAM enzyme
MASVKPYCTAPWNGITVRENGAVRTCCAGQKVIANLNVTSIQDIEQSPILKQIQDNMLSGQPDLENCASCMEQEKISGYDSLRNHYNTYHPDFDLNNITLKFVDIRWNNTCNLICMYCGPDSSSSWSGKLNTINLKPVKPYQDELLDWLLKKTQTVKNIMLVGGEPMLMKQNYTLLKHLPMDCHIDIITNLSYDLENLPCIDNLLARPRDHVMWNISAENIQQQFEYVRQNSNWNQFKNNLVFLQKHWPDTVSLNMVYSVFSAFDLPKTIQTFQSLGVKKFNFQPLYNNQTMNVYRMPEPIRQQALQCLEETIQYHHDSTHPDDLGLYPLQGIDQLKLQLQSDDFSNATISKEKFWKQIEWYNQWSQSKFQDLWPHVSELVNQHLV